jgi:hypothetical protein
LLKISWGECQPSGWQRGKAPIFWKIHAPLGAFLFPEHLGACCC